MTEHNFQNRYGYCNQYNQFFIFDGYDQVKPYTEYLIFFKNDTYVSWKAPKQFFDKTFRQIQYFLSYGEDAQFIFEQKDIKYVCSYASNYEEQIDYLQGCFGPDRPGTFEDE